jgi:hypothetical protein
MCNPAAIDGLKKQLRGNVLPPAHPGYNEVRTICNAMIDHRPAAIASAPAPPTQPTAKSLSREELPQISFPPLHRLLAKIEKAETRAAHDAVVRVAINEQISISVSDPSTVGREHGLAPRNKLDNI